jgi:hypothetical protein
MGIRQTFTVNGSGSGMGRAGAGLFGSCGVKSLIFKIGIGEIGSGFSDLGKIVWTLNFFSLDYAAALGMKRFTKSRQRGGRPSLGWFL